MRGFFLMLAVVGVWAGRMAAGVPLEIHLLANPSFEHGLAGTVLSSAFPPLPWTTLFDPFPEAQECLCQWRFQEALALFEGEGLQAGPTARLASLGRALCLLRQHRDTEAEMTLREIAEGNDRAALYAHFWLARMALEEGVVAEAEESLLRLLGSALPPDWGFELWERWAAAVAEADEVLDRWEERPWRSWAALFLTDEEEGVRRVEERLAEAQGGAWERVVRWAWRARREEGWSLTEAAADWQRAWEAARQEGETFFTAARALGLQALQAGDFARAAEWLEVYFAEAGKVGWVAGPWAEEVGLRYRLAEGLYRSKRWGSALEHYRAVLPHLPEGDPRYVVARLHQGLSAKELGLWPEAEEALREVLEQTGDPRLRVYAALRCAEVEAAQGQMEEGIRFLDEVSAREDLTGEQVGQLQLKAAFYEHEAHAYERAIERCERFLREHSEERGLCASVLLRLAYSYEYQGQLDRAEATYRRVIEGYEQFPEQVRVAKADLAFSVLAPQGELEPAIALTRAVLDEPEPTDPMGATLRYRLARFYLEMGQVEQALTELAAIPAGERGSDPHLDVRLWKPRIQAACLLRLGRLEAARQVLNEALKSTSSPARSN